MAVQDGMNGALRGWFKHRVFKQQFVTDLLRAPRWILTFELQNRSFNLKRKPIGMAIRSATTVVKTINPFRVVAFKDLIAGNTRYPELTTQRRHLLAIE